MEPKVHYTVVGAFVIVLGAALALIFFWLTAVKHDKVYHTYLVYVSEGVSGLTADSQVRYNGVPVGFVRKIELDPSNPQLVRIKLEIEEGTPITTSTVATLKTQGITGVIYVELTAETQHAPLLKARPGERYPVIPALPSLLLQLSEVVPKITKTVTELSDRITALLSVKNTKAITNTLQNIDKFSKTLAKNSKNLDASMQALRVTLDNAKITSKKLPALTDKMDKTLSSITSTSNAVKTTADKFSGAADEMKQTFVNSRSVLSNFNSQVMPSIQQLIMRLNNISSNLQGFSQTLTQNPAVIIRGKTPAAPGPGER